MSEIIVHKLITINNGRIIIKQLFIMYMYDNVRISIIILVSVKNIMNNDLIEMNCNSPTLYCRNPVATEYERSLCITSLLYISLKKVK